MRLKLPALGWNSAGKLWAAGRGWKVERLAAGLSAAQDCSTTAMDGRSSGRE